MFAIVFVVASSSSSNSWALNDEGSSATTRDTSQLLQEAIVHYSLGDSPFLSGEMVESGSWKSSVSSEDDLILVQRMQATGYTSKGEDAETIMAAEHSCVLERGLLNGRSEFTVVMMVKRTFAGSIPVFRELDRNESLKMSLRSVVPFESGWPLQRKRKIATGPKG
jgi:hypothetical protein